MRTEGRAIAQPDPLIGSTLLGRYRVLEQIGAGAMGDVYRAEQVGLGRPVALKVLKKQQDAGSDVMARFEREARAMSALAHPNTVRVYDFGATREGQLFLAMELLEGELASSCLGRGGTVSTSEAITWTEQVLRSIGEAHAKGIIHRDIKPDNIFLARIDAEAEPVVKVLDFGIAKSIEGERTLDQFETMDGTVFGTPRYMSPEQAQGKPLDHRSDLYAVGIVLYELLVGAPPFVDKDAVIVMAKHIREDPPPLRLAAPLRTFPASLQRVLDKALHKSPALRFQSAEEFEQALSSCLRYAELLDRVPRRGQKIMASVLGAPRWTRWALGAGGVLLVAAAASALALGHDRREAESKASAPTATANSITPTQAVTSDQPQAVETRLVTLYTEPRGVNVWRFSRFVGTTPLPLEVQRGHSLRVRLSTPGFETQTLDLSADEGTRMVKLERSRSAAHAPAAEGPTLTQRERTRPAKKQHRATAPEKPAADPAPPAYEKF